MPTASIWIVTYNNSADLNANLRSLWANANWDALQFYVNIISNHSRIELEYEFLGCTRVYHNNLRDDQNLGHLSRNWNQALQLGFGDLNNPSHDLVITSQDDVLWEPYWCENLVEFMKNHSFVTQGHGDAVVIYKPEAVKRIGMWDERFCPSFYHEGDYFLRAFLYNNQASSINDPGHFRVWQPLDKSIISIPEANQLRIDAKNMSYGHAELPFKIWYHKWACPPIYWDTEHMQNNPPQPQIPAYIQYPHFEFAVETLEQQKYFF
jgi:Glycosyl transferase family 2